jgi:hypothetical protein
MIDEHQRSPRPSTRLAIAVSAARQIDDLEPPAAGFDLVADFRNGAEFLQQEAGEGLVGPRRRQRDAEQVEFGAGISPRSGRSRRAPGEGLLRRSFLGVKGADDRFQDIRARHHALEGAVFVMDEADMNRRVAQDRHHVARIDALRNEQRLADQLADIRRLSRQEGVEQIL